MTKAINKTITEKNIVCDICHHNCLISENAYGFCGVRQNVKKKIVNQAYGKITALALDPIEKKPLYRFFPGSKILSVGSLGCNMLCNFCQNHHIARLRLDKIEEFQGKENRLWENYSPKALVEMAKRTKAQGNIGLAFTYNEPLINYEYIIDCAKFAKKKDSKLQIILVTNGHLNEVHREKLFPHIDAMNVDLKAFSEDFYKQMKGDFSLVKDFISKAVRYAHVELTYLLIPGLNDDPKELEEAAKWIASLKNDIPLHISRFFPQYKLVDRNATSIAAVHEAVNGAKKYLEWVFAGNV